MIQALPTGGGAPPLRPATLLTILLLIGGSLYFASVYRLDQPPEVHLATGSVAGGVHFSYQVITHDLEVNWTNSGDFDPRGKCPKDFFAAGFTVVYKKLKDGTYLRFLHHQGKQLLYRIDKEILEAQARIGLHWVESTRFGAKYRIADPAFKGGKTVAVPNSKGGQMPRTFTYGEAVSKKRVQWNRELFHQTHIQAGQCRSWWDIFNFRP